MITSLPIQNTFHGMGMIATVTPGINRTKPISRLKVTATDISTVGKIQIRYHKQQSHGMSTVVHQKLYKLKAQNPTAELDLLWKSSLLFGSARPG